MKVGYSSPTTWHWNPCLCHFLSLEENILFRDRDLKDFNVWLSIPEPFCKHHIAWQSRARDLAWQHHPSPTWKNAQSFVWMGRPVCLAMTTLEHFEPCDRPSAVFWPWLPLDCLLVWLQLWPWHWHWTRIEKKRPRKRHIEVSLTKVVWRLWDWADVQRL